MDKPSNWVITFRRELYAASSRGRYGNPFSVTGVWSMKMNTQCTWHAGGSLWRKQMSICGNKRAPVGTTSSSFLSSRGHFVSEVWVLCLLWNALGGVRSVSVLSDTRWHTRLMRYVFGRRGTHALFSREWVFHCELFSWESSAPRFVPFL